MNDSERNIAAAAAGAVLAVTGYAAGAILNPKPRKIPVPQPICGCGHHISMHGDGECAWTNTKKVLTSRSRPRTSTDEYGNSTTIYGSEEFEYIKETCPCKKYAGPQHNPNLDLPQI